ncbi:c-di-GMP-binding flagellar brake protein YcgR, contains PilZNR and PilZ domains [Lachnospiraceae bacterium]|nr:c-di-GMP-binding flagellar brake protein YcgR, contains PilZNR and PilZ domains [Lachnospiraceae bacterium]
MLSEYIVPGDRLELTAVHDMTGINIAEQMQGTERKVYRTRIHDIRTEDEIEIEMPLDHGTLQMLPVGGEYDLCFYSRKGLYQCYATVIDRFKSNNFFILVMNLKTNLRKFQRREYYRLNCVLEMKCRKLTQEEEKVMEDLPVEFMNTDFTLEDGLIVDISGGGARFISDITYDTQDRILFKFTLEIDRIPRNYSLMGRVVCSNPLDGQDGKYEVRVQFVNIDGKDRESIIRYIFEEQRKIRHKSQE